MKGYNDAAVSEDDNISIQVNMVFSNICSEFKASTLPLVGFVSR